MPLNSIQRLLVIGFFLLALPSYAAESARPNFLVIMADDLGFSDLGCYGSEIETPHLDALAARGLRFSQFYNTAKCHSSRVSLLSGQYCIAAGDTSLKHAVTSAEILREAGYFTAMSGKWHLDREPTDFGFDRYFGHLSGACNYFTGDSTFRLNGEAWTVPETGFYTTVAKIDHALGFLNEARETSLPWFLYVAFNAPHAPLHALPEDYAKYQGRYDVGWDEIREQRVGRQKELGLFPESLEASPRPDHVPAWESMEPWKRHYEANRMTTLAAMIDRVDQEVGRLIASLEENEELENTLILFVSDNGACPYDRRAPRLDVEPTDGETSLGDSTGWSWARNSPFRYYKQNQFEGGISTPAIVHWPAGLKTEAGSVIDQPAHLIDVLPTLVDLADSRIPDQWKERTLRPVSGISLKPLFKADPLPERPPIHLLFSKDRGLRDGDWKLVSFQGKAWELYHLAEDRTELNNLAASEPDRLKRMVDTWNRMAKDVLHAPANVYSPVAAAGPPHRHREWTNFAATTPEDYTTRKSRSTPAGSGRSKLGKGIRARKNTELKIVAGELQLTFSGEDPGIAMDLRGRNLPPGPYRLTFRLLNESGSDGEVLFTTDPQQFLPKGVSRSFPTAASDQWQTIEVILDTEASMKQLRLDIGDGPGNCRIKDLKLLHGPDDADTVLIQWPEKQP